MARDAKRSIMSGVCEGGQCLWLMPGSYPRKVKCAASRFGIKISRMKDPEA